jgi:peptidoglycan/LPS O-acetylase OafA/YrhL
VTLKALRHRQRPLQPSAATQDRVVWLDGLRGAAAMFVVLHHAWLTTWPDFPHNDGPWWLGWLLYGHLAVAVFIVVSGFSLALAPMRDNEQLRGGASRFVRRRAWRILPAYWAALIFSMLITAYLLRPDLGAIEVSKSLAVHGLLLQDVVGSQTPNGAFWSIAVEWQIYFVFPLILLVGRKWSLKAAVILTIVAVLIAHTVAGLGTPFSKLDELTPQFLALFALGVLAVKLGGTGENAKLSRWLGGLALAALLAVVASAILHGSEWMVAHFFYVDLVFGLFVVCALYLLFTGGAVAARRPLTSRKMLRLGLFSYSIYLMHAPILGVLNKYLIGPLGIPALAKFGLLLVVGLPLVLVLCYGFHLLFEAPFLRHRGVRALQEIPGVQLILRGRGASTVPATEVAMARGHGGD